MSISFYHQDLADAQWNRIKYLIERRPLNPRKVFDGILWMLKSGARWHDLPSRYSNWNSIYHKFRHRCGCGLFERLLKLVNRNARNSSVLEMDSTFCKVHQSDCSGLKNQAIGISRGGKNTKIHVLLNERMQLLNIVLTGGQIHVSEPTLALLAGIELSDKKVLTDRAFHT